MKLNKLFVLIVGALLLNICLFSSQIFAQELKDSVNAAQTKSTEQPGKWYRASDAIMGTNIYTEVWADSPELGEQATRAVMQEMNAINQRMSPYIEDSELSKINRLASQSPVEVSKQMFEVLALAQQISDLSFGAFDVTFASVGFLYDYRTKKRPNANELDELLAAVNYQLIELDRENQTVFFKHPNVKIDLGGIAKGLAVDNAIERLRGLGIEHALVTAGGDTRLLGDRLGEPWIVGIRDPRDKDKQAVVIPLVDIAMSTSGDYERYFEDDGQRYHHILSPKTGKSVESVQSVSIIGPQSVYNDALSTAVFVLGVQDGIGLINSLDNFDVIVMDAERKLHYSDGLKN